MNNPLTPDQQTMLAKWQRFLASLPSDIELIPVFEIFGQDRLVEEMVALHPDCLDASRRATYRPQTRILNGRHHGIPKRQADL